MGAPTIRPRHTRNNGGVTGMISRVVIKMAPTFCFDCDGSRRASLRQTRSASIAAEMETLASEYATGIISTREAGRRLGLPSSSIRNILHGVLNRYPYNLQSCHELLPSDTIHREASAR
ncbi:uncharacterized protein TNIN_79951 [Trichonephila inaurata madagascariensis]|uniref:Uncharacterized protein n=1 Tax=Trichonephila inaurata madagascariensis TaxID=2747483 RepID=A0A8X7C2A9_9ARAC|nr:uncharacterized protein TNIN_79951 [Trichonephila inaurata madagascariensis]